MSDERKNTEDEELKRKQEEAEKGSREDAQKVLDELSELLHRECTFETVYVPLRKQKGAYS